MKRLFAATTLALALIGGVVTTAQADNRDRYERRYDRHDGRHHGDRRDHREYRDHRDHRYYRYDRDWDRQASFRRHDGRPYRYVRYERPSGYYHRSWSYHDRLPRAYYAPHYVVNDYYSYRLRPPPYGYHWVRVDHDVVLAAIASGLVVQAVYGIFD